MGHAQHFQTAVFSDNGCFGFYRHDTKTAALESAINALHQGHFAIHFEVIKAFPPCPPELQAVAKAEQLARSAEFAAQVQAKIDSTGWDFDDDIPW